MCTMTYGSILRAWLFSIVCASHVLAAIPARHSQVSAVQPAAAEPPVFSVSSSSGDEVLDVAIDVHHAANDESPAASGGGEGVSGFEGFLAGLTRLSEAVSDVGRDWQALEHVLSSAPGQHGHKTDFRDQVQKLFAFAGTTERLIREVMQKYSDDSSVEMRSDGGAVQQQQPVMNSSGRETTPSSAAGVRAELTATVTHLLTLFDQYFGRQTLDDAHVSVEESREEGELDSLQLLVDALEAVAQAHTNYTAAIAGAKPSTTANSFPAPEDRTLKPSPLSQHSSSPATLQADSAAAAATNATTAPPAAERRPLGWHDNQSGLLQVVAQLKALLTDNGGDAVHLTTANAAQTVSTSSSTTTTPTTTTATPLTTTTPTTTTATPLTTTTTTPLTTTTTTSTTTTQKGEDRERPCVPPFEQIAYRMCILQEMQLRLSWSDAQEFCRERGADLAQDMTVIKARRFLNDLYGEEGTRTRWPVWVGGRRIEQQQTWKWTGFAGDLDVPSFMWAPGEPRAYSSDLMPEGVCMILDGYRRFHGASLPCHLRRRFVCELRN